MLKHCVHHIWQLFLKSALCLVCKRFEHVFIGIRQVQTQIPDVRQVPRGWMGIVPAISAVLLVLGERVWNLLSSFGDRDLHGLLLDLNAPPNRARAFGDLRPSARWVFVLWRRLECPAHGLRGAQYTICDTQGPLRRTRVDRYTQDRPCAIPGPCYASVSKSLSCRHRPFEQERILQKKLRVIAIG